MTPNSLRTPAFAALLTLGLLSACGSVTGRPDAASGHALSAQATLITDLPKNYKYLHTLTIPTAVTAAALLKMYGGYMVAFHPELGTAIIANNNATKGSYDGTTVELSTRSYRVSELGFSTWATGFGTWASGYSTWASGYSTWASGTTGSGSATTFTENVPLWNMIKLSEAQSLVPELGSGIKVAVIDSGIDLNHPAFNGKLDTSNAKDYIDGDGVPQEVNANTTGGYSDGYGHGTAAASVLLQVAPKVTILPIRALDANGLGDTSTIASAVDYAVSKGARVINLSLGSTTYSDALNTSIKNAVSKGVAVICAAGNSGDTRVLYPAYSADTTGIVGNGSVGVGSVSSTFLKSSFSTYGPNLEMTAPGENVIAAFPGSQTVSVTGTSFSTPVVSGIVALALSTGMNVSTASSLNTLLTNLNKTATPASDPSYLTALGYGTINAYTFIHLYR
ncbi:hypothetical protein HNQ07_004674 [Deinococcus metalli]|uniref:Serine protease n=1 Tax=Deinococcus metalli TaxID=1141878 RepID=A0A7W8NQK5_9DEIO|nr:S8 family serine peptidase [Deinococcus metalli]MBB5379159.1 hypothetical protein [Deinococcus metalli]GHF64576.1 serine protease [Deinococcus metalli]